MTANRAVPGLLIVVLVSVALSSVALTVVGLQRSAGPEPVRASDPAVGLDVGPAAGVLRPEVAAAEVLAAWDADRAAAWAAGDVRRLRSLYTPGSVAGRHDAAMLGRWLARGLVVDGLRTQLLSLEEVSRSADRWVLDVVDRVVGGTAGTDIALPADAPTSRTVVLRLVEGEWLVAAVQA